MRMDSLRGGMDEWLLFLEGGSRLAADGFPLIVMCDMLDPSAFWDINTLPCGGLSHTGILIKSLSIFCHTFMHF